MVTAEDRLALEAWDVKHYVDTLTLLGQDIWAIPSVRDTFLLSQSALVAPLRAALRKPE